MAQRTGMIAVPWHVSLMMQKDREKNYDRQRDTDQPKKQTFSETHNPSSFRMWRNNGIAAVSVPCAGSRLLTELFEERIV
jgi:hypothetical protein